MNNRTVRDTALLCMFANIIVIIIGYHNQSPPTAAYGIALTVVSTWVAIHYHRKVKNGNRRTR